MSGIPHGSAQLKRANDELDTRCRVADEAGAECGETESLGVLEQFQKIYAERLKRLDGDGELAMHTLKSWVHDLTEQNAMLVRTVEELESELLKRVDLMHDQLRKTSLVVKRKEQLAKREKTEVELNLRQQVQLLQKDVSSLLDIINQSKQQGFSSVDNIKLHTISKSQLMDALPKSTNCCGANEDNIPSKLLETALIEEFSSPSTNFKSNKNPNAHDQYIQTEEGTECYQYSTGDVKESCPFPITISTKGDDKMPDDAQSNPPLEVLNLSAMHVGKGSSILSTQCDPHSQTMGIDVGKVYQASFSVPMDQERIYICTVPVLNEVSLESSRNLLVSVPQNASFLNDDGDTHQTRHENPTELGNDAALLKSNLVTSSTTNRLVSSWALPNRYGVKPYYQPPDFLSCKDSHQRLSNLADTTSACLAVAEVRKMDGFNLLPQKQREMSMSTQNLPGNSIPNFLKQSDQGPCGNENCVAQSVESPSIFQNVSQSIACPKEKMTIASATVRSKSDFKCVTLIGSAGQSSIAADSQISPCKDDCSSLSCKFVDSLENLDDNGTFTRQPLECEIPQQFQLKKNLATQPSSPSEGGVGDMENNVNVDSLKAQLADRDMEIHNLLERIEEMKNIYTLTLNQVKNAVETEKKCMQDLATSCRVFNRDSGDLPTASHADNDEVNMTPWVHERLKQQQEQITILISKARDLESNLNMVTKERDNLAHELEASSRSHQSFNQGFTQTLSDPSMIILSKELETTRQQLAEASTHVKSLATCIKALEKKNNETQIALTGEVAEKHDQIVDLRKEAHQLEEQIKNANTQIIYRDSIIKEMRNELKVARKKMSYLGVDVPAGSLKSFEDKKILCKSQPSPSDPVLSNNGHPNPKYLSRSRHSLKYSQSLPSCLTNHSKKSFKSKLEQTSVEETLKTKAKSKFCSRNFKMTGYSRHEFSFPEGRENVTDKENLNFSVKEGLKDINTSNVLKESEKLQQYYQKQSTVLCGSSVQTNDLTLHPSKSSQIQTSCSCCITHDKAEDIMSGKTSFYTSPFECFGDQVADKQYLDISDVKQVSDSVIFAQIPSIPLPHDKVTHLIISLPAEAIAASDPRVVCQRSNETIELFPKLGPSSEGSEIDIVNSSESLAISSECNSDLDNKSKRKAFAAIPEASSVCDSGLDDGELSSSSHYLQAEIDLLRTQLKEQHKLILEKDEELAAQKQEVLRLEKHIGDQNKTKVKTITSPQLPAITLRELEEYRLCTVEGQAAVEELRDEIEAILSDIKIQESKLLGIQMSAVSASEKMQNSQQKLAQGSAYPATLVTIYDAVEDAKECIIDFQQRTDDFVRERRAGEQRRQSREKKVDKLQEQLETAHDNMRDGIESMEQALAERYEADRLSQPEYSDGSSYHSCRDSDSSSRIKQVERLEESNAELLSTLTTMERLKRDAEIKAAQCVQEVELMKAQISRRSFTEEMLHTKEQTIRELQGALDSTRRQVRDLQSEYERIARERDQTLKILEESANSGPLQVAELQSELARLRNQLSSLSSLQALVEQYERRLKDSSDQAERLSSQLNSVTLNLQAKEKMLSNKEEMVNILQDTLDRTHEELKLLKDKSVSKSSFALPWRNGKKKTGAASSVTALPDQDEASGTNGSVSDEVSGSSGVWGWARNTAARKHRVHDVETGKGYVFQQQWLVVRELKLDLSEMLNQYRDCFSEVSRQTRWYRDLREAYQDLRAHAENVKREALLSVNNSQREVEVLKRQLQAQNVQQLKLKGQMWEAEQNHRQAEFRAEELQQKNVEYSQQIKQLASKLNAVQTQLKDAQTRMELSEEQEELRQLREFRDKCERAARSLADVGQPDKDCWGGLQWCGSSESEDSQKREARLQATLGLLLVEAGRRRRASGRDPVFKDCDSASTDGSTKSREQKQNLAPPPPCNSQGQLQGVLEENQQLRDQLSQLQDHNASLALQLQTQCDESARSLAEISSTLLGNEPSSRSEILQLDGAHTSSSLVMSQRRQGTHPGAARHFDRQVAVGRASRASSSSGSSGRGAGGPGGHAGSPSSTPQGVAPAAEPWDYSDHTDLCDSGFWSLQASPPRASSVLAGPSSPARLCWLGRPCSPSPSGSTTPSGGGGGGAAATTTASGATTFILNARRPRPPPHQQQH